MNNTECNGWTNYATWAVSLWMTNDAGSHEYWHSDADRVYNRAHATEYSTQKQVAIRDLADVIKEHHEEAMDHLRGIRNTVFSDLLTSAMSDVNWDEIAANLLEEYPDNEV